MTIIRKIFCSMLLGVLAACGGGGGDSGAGTGGSAGGGGASTGPTLAIAIVDANDVAVSSNAVGSAATFVKATLKTAAGAPIANRLVTFSTVNTVALLTQASVLTDANGVARVGISPASTTSTSAAAVTATATVDGTAVTASLDFQTSAANVTLTQFSVLPNAISAMQSAAVTVRALVNGNAAGAGAVGVTFSASCGTFSPASATSAANGTVTTVYQSAAACSGPVVLTAQAPGSSPVTTTVNVQAAQPANLLFDGSDRTTIFTSAASSGVKQARVSFKVVDFAGGAMASQPVLISLSSTALNAGVRFAGGSSAPQTVNTNANGIAAVTITSGPLPTPVIVTAQLGALSASSLTLAVTSGVPTQNAASISATKLSIEALNIDGVTTEITMRIADRQGNPVPEGAAVTFVASHGLVTGSCNLNAQSACTVTYSSQGARPVNGRAVILAYLDGEESFVDVNGNNLYDNGEAFFDTGTVFRDDNEDGIYQPAEQLYPGGMVGTSACPMPSASAPSVAGTCDNVWSSSIRVRRQITIALASSTAVITRLDRNGTRLIVGVSDVNGNSMPTGTTVSAAIGTVSSACTVVSVSPNVVPNSNAASVHTVILNGDPSCSAAVINVTVTTPGGRATTQGFGP